MKNFPKCIFVSLLIIVALCRFVVAQEIVGPVVVKPGLPAVFELPSKAAWTVTPVDLAGDKFLTDSSGTKIFFASPVEATYTIVAAFLADDEIVQAVHIFSVSSKDDVSPNPNPEPDPQPDPEPTPEPDTLAAWVAKNAPTGDKTRLAKVATVYAGQADGLGRNLIRTTDAAYYGIRKGMQPLVIGEDWQNFQKALDEQLAKTLAAKKSADESLTDKEALRLAFAEISEGMEEAAK